MPLFLFFEAKCMIQGKLQELEKRAHEIESLISKPEVMANQEHFKALTQEHSQISPLVQKYKNMEKSKKELELAKEHLKDEKDEEMKMLFMHLLCLPIFTKKSSLILLINY